MSTKRGKKRNEHLAFDLEFLEKESAGEDQTQTTDASDAKRPKADNGRRKAVAPGPVETESAEEIREANGWVTKALVIMGATGVGVIVVAMFLIGPDAENPATSSNSPSVPTEQRGSDKGDLGAEGRWKCSGYDGAQADALAPSEAEKRHIERETAALKDQGSEIRELEARLEGMGVTGYSADSEISKYNALVDKRNEKVRLFLSRSGQLERNMAQYEEKIDAYNDYLAENCSLEK